MVVTGNTDKKSQSTTSGFIRIIHPEAAAAAVAAAAKPSTKKPTVAASLAASGYLILSQKKSMKPHFQMSQLHKHL